MFTKKSLSVITLCVMFLFCAMMVLTPQIAYCEENTSAATNQIASAVETTANWIYKTMRAIITPISICAFGFAGFQFILGGASGAEKARKAIIGAVVSLCLVIFAPLFGQAIATSFSGFGGGDLSSFNPLD